MGFIIPNQVLIFHSQQFTPIWCSCFLDLPSTAAHLKRLLSWASIEISSYSAYWLTYAFSSLLAVLGKKNIGVLIGKTSYSVRTSYKYLQTVSSDPGATSSMQTKFTIVIEAWASLPDENNDIISSKTLLNSTWPRTVSNQSLERSNVSESYSHLYQTQPTMNNNEMSQSIIK